MHHLPVSYHLPNKKLKEVHSKIVVLGFFQVAGVEPETGFLIRMDVSPHYCMAGASPIAENRGGSIKSAHVENPRNSSSDRTRNGLLHMFWIIRSEDRVAFEENNLGMGKLAQCCTSNLDKLPEPKKDQKTSKNIQKT